MTRRLAVTTVLALSLLAACGPGGGATPGESVAGRPSTTEQSTAEPSRTGPSTTGQQSSAAGQPPAATLAGSESRATSSLAEPGLPGMTRTDEDPLSTFALDVDTASYDYAARALADGRLPDPTSVRAEEFVNAFDQDYAEPDGDGIALYVDGARPPRAEQPGTRLVRVGLATRSAEEHERRPATLTFVVDVSGSMSEPGRLDLVQAALGTLVDRLGPADSVGIVAYSSSARVVSPVRSVSESADLHSAIAMLRPGASTNLESGLLLGYDVARQGYRAGTTNRVVLLTDGLANTGSTDADQILAEVHEQAGKGIALLTVGVGSDYGDALMERLADRGDGITAYVHTRAQAEEVFVHRLPTTIDLRAVDAKAQVRFNPGAVSTYRLIGYDDRAVADGDFRNDAVDGGELGAGHRVTALYVVTLRAGATGEVASATVRWQDPGGTGSREATQAVSVDDVSVDLGESALRLQADVVAATFAERLRGRPVFDDADTSDLESLSEDADRVAAGIDDPAVSDLADLVHVATRLRSGVGRPQETAPRW